MPTRGGDSDVTPCFSWIKDPINEECLSKGRRGVIEDTHEKGLSSPQEVLLAE